jgi:3-oxoadipate enol-lactonase
MATHSHGGRVTQVHRVAMLGGATIAAYLDVVGPNAPWVVFSNSLATDWRIWNAQARALAGGWKVLR